MAILSPNDVFIEKQMLPIVKHETLDPALRSNCPNFTGLSTGSLGVVLHFTPNANAAERETARQLALAHDPSELTVEEADELDLKQTIAALRTEVLKSSDPIAQAVALLLERL